MTKIRAVTFDVGGTLIAPWPSVGHVYARVAAATHGINADPDLITRQFIAAWKLRGEFDYSEAGWFDLVRSSFAGIAEVPRTLFNALYDSFSTHDAWKTYADALPTLEALRARDIRLAVISNWDTRLRPTLRNLALDHYFEHITVSAEIGHHKPAPQIFQHTAQALKLHPHEILHIGDSHREDYQGARQSGFHSLLIDREATSAIPEQKSAFKSNPHPNNNIRPKLPPLPLGEGRDEVVPPFQQPTPSTIPSLVTLLDYI